MSDIVDKIRKLLELSRSDNEHEAAAAAARAADLMHQHQVDEAELQAARPESERRVAPAARAVLWTGPSVTWRWQIAAALADSFGGVAFYGRSATPDAWDTVIIGPEPCLGGCSYMYGYLTAEIARLADAAYADEAAECAASGIERPSARGWKGAFRVGAAVTIAKRLREQHQVSVGRARAAAKPAALGQTTALAIIDQQARACVALAREQAPFLFRADGKMRAGTTSYAGTSSRSGRQAGEAAGRSVHLGGGRALGAAKGQLR